ncbi:hypothetical protein CBW65_05595 [Tumebacillus avium]|uniref:Uncharacterized protein n=1 Tax=Tumebacillus avium TaxID=1903704 RepID=A0A1Y0IMM6_9BACL|nr:hypothetical protein CBW65_05595 [Tumebacillus avium]
MKKEWLELKHDGARAMVRIVLVLLFLLPVCYFRTDYLLYETARKQVELGIMDGIITIFGEPFAAILLAPLFLYLIQEIVSFDANEQITLRYGSRSSIWAAKVKKIFVHAFLFTCMVTAVEAVVGAPLLDYQNTWTSPGGMLHLIASAMDAQQGSSHMLTAWEQNQAFYHPIVIIGLTMIFGTLGLSSAAMAASIVSALTNRAIVGYFVVLLICLIDVFSRSFSLLFRQTIITHAEWLSFTGLFWNGLYLLGICAVLIMVGRSAWERKEYLFAKDKETVGDLR